MALGSLTTLDLSHLKITDTGLKELKELQNLRGAQPLEYTDHGERLERTLGTQ